MTPQQPAQPPALLYDSPEIYDVAFGWDLEMELTFVDSLFLAHAVDPVRRVPGAARGPGRGLAPPGKRGIAGLGYDLSAEQGAYASAELIPLGGRGSGG